MLWNLPKRATIQTIVGRNTKAYKTRKTKAMPNYVQSSSWLLIKFKVVRESISACPLWCISGPRILLRTTTIEFLSKPFQWGLGLRYILSISRRASLWCTTLHNSAVVHHPHNNFLSNDLVMCVIWLFEYSNLKLIQYEDSYILFSIYDDYFIVKMQIHFIIIHKCTN